MDPIQVSEYAMDIFEYMKRREKAFVVKDYMTLQVHITQQNKSGLLRLVLMIEIFFFTQPVITKWMRSLLVDWMVDVQENFELNHETLYLGVKITDLYLSHVVVAKENLQLVGAAALFLASKYEVIIIKYHNFNDVILTFLKMLFTRFF